MWSIGLYLATLLAICFICLIYKRRNSRSNEVVLPPGSLGLLFLGETLQLLRPYYSLDLPYFFRSRIQRYGPIFKTRILGKPVVVSADVDFNRYLVQQEGRLVELWHAASEVFELEGEHRASAAGLIHKYQRNNTLKLLGSERLRGDLLPLLDDLVRKSLHGWSTQESIDVKAATVKMVVEFAAEHIFGYDAEKSKIKLGEKFSDIIRGLFSIPLNIPGTAYSKCSKSKREVKDMLREALKEKMASSDAYRGDFLDHALKDLNTETFLTENFILNVIFGILFSSSESMSTTLTLILKFLSENPHALEELEAEHERILRSRENPDSPLTWKEVKSMTFTLQVLNESLRLGNVTFGVTRKVLTDIQINGYTIPAGWIIFLLTSACQYNSDIYEDPLTFNPWRWKDIQPEVISKTFTPFGGGSRQCAGAEFAKVLIPIVLHVLVTDYRWKKIKGGEIVRKPLLGFKNALHINLAQKATRTPEKFTSYI